MTAGTLVLGNSVSAQRDGYVAELHAKVHAAGLQPVVNASLGGVGSIGLLALMDNLVLRDGARFVILESSLGDSAGATHIHDLENVLHELCLRVSEIADHGVVALHIPRFDVDLQQQATVVAIHNAVLSQYGIPSIDLTGRLVSANTIDGVHLNPSGSAIVAGSIFDHFELLPKTKPQASMGKEYMRSFRFLSITDPEWTNLGEASAFRASLRTTRVGAAGSARVELFGFEPVALVMIVGPSVGVIAMNSERHSVRVQTWDAWCTFRRIQVVHVPIAVRSSPYLDISAVANSSAPIDAWGLPSSIDHAGDVAEVAGVLLRQKPLTEVVGHE